MSISCKATRIKPLSPPPSLPPSLPTSSEHNGTEWILLKGDLSFLSLSFSFLVHALHAWQKNMKRKHLLLTHSLTKAPFSLSSSSSSISFARTSKTTRTTQPTDRRMPEMDRIREEGGGEEKGLSYLCERKGGGERCKDEEEERGRGHYQGHRREERRRRCHRHTKNGKNSGVKIDLLEMEIFFLGGGRGREGCVVVFDTSFDIGFFFPSSLSPEIISFPFS